VPIRDKSAAKDILKLIEPTSATDNLKALFSNQVIPLNEVILADKEHDQLNNSVSRPMSNGPFASNVSFSVPYAHPRVCRLNQFFCSNQHIITVQLPKKFGVHSCDVCYHMPVTDCPKALASLYNSDTIQCTTKKRVLSSDPKLTAVPDKAIEVLVDEESAALKPGTPHF
jgi:hypothetical protein